MLFFTGFVAILAFVSSTAVAGDLDYAPPSFSWEGGAAVPVDFITERLEVTADASAESGEIRMSAEVRFYQAEDGFPFFDLCQKPQTIVVDGRSIAPDALAEVEYPGSDRLIRVLRESLEGGREHRIKVTYRLNTSSFYWIRVGDGALDLAFLLCDMDSNREYFEQYAPAGLRYDAFELKLRLRTVGVKVKDLQVLANGKVERLNDQLWEVTYPEWYTTSSFLLVATNQSSPAQERQFESVDGRRIPVLISDPDGSEVSDDCWERLRGVFEDHERSYGPYPHAQLLVVLGWRRNHNMEYSGAYELSGNRTCDHSTDSHELLHSWFARSVMPASNNDEWIDEEIAYWGETPRKRPDHLSGDSIAEDLDFLMADEGGLIPVLRQLHRRKRHQVISTDEFIRILDDLSQADIRGYFEQYHADYLNQAPTP
jgi:hypothetical protein